MTLHLDAELGALREHFLARELHLLGDGVHADRIARLARGWRRQGSGLRCRGGRGAGTPVGVRLVAFRAVASTTPPTTTAPAATAALAILVRTRGAAGASAALIALGGLVRVVVLHRIERVGEAALVLVDVGEVVEAARED